MKPPIVTTKSVPPAGKPGECLWCKEKVGNEHKMDCSAVVRTAKIRVIIEYEVDVHGGGALNAEEVFEFNRNEGSWCASNVIAELQKLINSGRPCLCDITKIAFLNWTSDVLKEHR
jgi:hypothetical protein